MAATKTKIKTAKKLEIAPAEAVASSGEVNEFSDPSAALVPGSEMNLAVLDGNKIEAPAEETSEFDPKAEEAHNRLKKLLVAADDNYYAIAADLSYLSSQKSFAQMGYKTFEDYLDKELRMVKRKGQYYVQVYNCFETKIKQELKDRPAAWTELMRTIREVGWTRGRILARFQIIKAEKDNVDEVIEKLKTLTTREFETYCKTKHDAEATDDDKDEDKNTVRMSFQCFLPQKDDIEAALELANVMIGKEGTTKSSCLAWACRDFVATNVAAQGKTSKESLAEFLSKYERLLGIELIAIDPTTKQVAFGQETLERLSK